MGGGFNINVIIIIYSLLKQLSVILHNGLYNSNIHKYQYLF
jgi:hypothetical protein